MAREKDMEQLFLSASGVISFPARFSAVMSECNTKEDMADIVSEIVAMCFERDDKDAKRSILGYLLEHMRRGIIGKEKMEYINQVLEKRYPNENIRL